MKENEYENKYYCELCKCDHRRTSKVGEKHYLQTVDMNDKKRLPHWIKDGICINETLKNICNLGYACDGCPYNKASR